MKRTFVMILLLNAHFVGSGGTDFRKTNWKMTMDEVIKSESGSLINKHENEIAFRDKIYDHDALTKNILIRGPEIKAKMVIS